MIVLDLGVGPPDELSPSESIARVVGSPIGVVGRGIDSNTVEIEGLNVVVVVGDNNFQVVIIVNIADSHVEAIASEA